MADDVAVPDYCRVMQITGEQRSNRHRRTRRLVSASDGTIKQLVFPRGLDLDVSYCDFYPLQQNF